MGISLRACRPFTKAVSSIIKLALNVPISIWNKSTDRFTDEKEVAFQHLARANHTSEWMWTFYVKYVAFAISEVVVMTLMSVLHCYLSQGDFITQNYYQPLKFVYETEAASRVLLNHKTIFSQRKYCSFCCVISVYLGTSRQI